MRTLRLILFLLLISTTSSYAHKDLHFIRLDTLQNRSINTSDLIFLGHLMSIDTINMTLSFKILEKFKGDFKSVTVKIKKEMHAPIYYADKSLWLVYANHYSDSTFITNKHALTRSIIHPEEIQSYIMPSPPPLNDRHKAFLYIEELANYRNTALKDWYVELELLRQFKNDNMNNGELWNLNYTSYFYISLLSNLLCISLVVYLLFRIKKANRKL